MTRRVYLHVGAPKTGTTYLQDRLAANRRDLAEHDVHYPLGLTSSHFRAALDLIDVSWGGQREGARGEWERLVDRVQRLDDTVIVSHEILAGARQHQVERAMADLEGSEVHLVYSARDLARQIPAEWQEGVKHRRRRSFARFLDEVQKAKRRNPEMWFWRVQGLPDVLTRWGAGLPPDQIHVVTVPQAGAPRDLLWHRYCAAFGIDPAWAPDETSRENVSVGSAETTLLRRLNRRLRKSGLSGADYRRIIRQVTVHEALAQRQGMTRTTLPPDAYPWAEEIAEEWIEWIHGSGVDVVGDVEDLRPVPPPEDEPWRDPDRPNRKEVIDAALDALVAVTLEAAGRPDPNDQLSAKVGRAARRLRGQ